VASYYWKLLGGLVAGCANGFDIQKLYTGAILHALPRPIWVMQLAESFKLLASLPADSEKKT
jgi:hypothetical protein